MYSLIELLATTPLFRNLNQNEVGLFASVCTEHTLATNSVLFDQGDPGGELYLVLEGKLEAHKPFIGKVNTFAPGDYLGEFSLLDGAPRSASVIAAERSRVASLSQSDFNTICNQRSDIGYRVMQNMALELVVRVKEHEERLMDMLLRGRRL